MISYAFSSSTRKSAQRACLRLATLSALELRTMFKINLGGIISSYNKANKGNCLAFPSSAFQYSLELVINRSLWLVHCTLIWQPAGEILKVLHYGSNKLRHAPVKPIKCKNMTNHDLVIYHGLLALKCEVKMTGYWPCSFFVCLWIETQGRSIMPISRPAILTEQAWSIKEFLHDKNNFLAEPGG